jgi:hypothetical protein
VGTAIGGFGRVAVGGTPGLDVRLAPRFGLVAVLGPLDGRAAFAHGVGVFLAGKRFRPLLGAGVVLAGLLLGCLLGTPAAVVNIGDTGVVVVARAGGAVDAHRHAPAATVRR